MPNKWRYRNKERGWKRVVKLILRILFVFLVIVLLIVNLLSSIQSCVYAYNVGHFSPPGTLYKINDQGDKMHLHCMGTGSPVVLLQHSVGGQALDWSWVQPEVAKTTKTCSFDRAGYGWSDPIGRERTSDMHADGLHSLLESAGLAGDNFIFVTHSMAGVYARTFIHKYPQHKVCGLVCVDCIDPNTTDYKDWEKKQSPPFMWDIARNLMPSGTIWMMVATNTLPNITTIKKLPKDTHEEYLQNIFKPQFPDSTVLEFQDQPKSIHQSVEYGLLGDLPLTIIAAGKGLNETQLTYLSSNSTLLYLENAAHDLIFVTSYTRAIVREITALVQVERMSGCNTFYPGPTL